MRGSVGKLTPEQVRAIRAVAAAARPKRQRWRKPLARQLGVSPKYLTDVALGVRYGWVQ